MESWVFEVGTDLLRVGEDEGRDVMFAPFVVPLLFLESLGDLALLVVGAGDVTEDELGEFICFEDRGVLESVG